MRHLSETLRRKRPAPDGLDVPEGLEDRVLAHLSRAGGAFTLDHVRRALYREQVPLEDLGALTRQVLSDPRVMPLYGHDATTRAPRFTTVETFAAEEQLVRLATRLHADTSSHAAPPPERHIERFTRGLDPHTEAAARALLSPGRLSVVTLASDHARALALQSAIRTFNRAGTHVLACGTTARSLRAYEDAPAAQHTVHALLRRLQTRRSVLQRTSVIIVNDAEALDTDTLHTLARITHEARVRLVLVGDPRNPSRSAAFDWLCEHCAPSALEHRAPDHVPADDRPYVAGALDSTGLLRHLESSARLHRAENPASVIASVVEAWHRTETAHPEDSQLVLTRNADEADAANAAIQSARAADGRLGTSEHYEVVRPAYTAPEPPGVSAGAIARVPDATETITVHAGDRLRILENHRGAGLVRGDVGTVLSVAPRRLRILVDGAVRTFDPQRFNRFGLGYASSVHRQSAPADHVHATVSSLWRRAAVFRAATSHHKSLTFHWEAAPGQTVDDLASAIDTSRGPTCTQSYIDRQHALHAAHSTADTHDSAHRQLRTAWQLLPDEDRDQIQDQDREQRAAIHACQRPSDDTPSWLRTAPAASVASAIRTALRYRTEGAAAIDYQYHYDVLNAELADIARHAGAESRSALDDERYPQVLHRLQHLADDALARAETSDAFRFAFNDKTRFTLADLETHREDCAHGLRAHHIHTETRNMASYFHTRGAGWSLAVTSVLDKGAELSGTARVLADRPWFLDDYAGWYAGVAELERDREALAEARGKLSPQDAETANVLQQFDAASRHLAETVHYHQREERAAELVADYAALQREFIQQRDTLYRHRRTRTGPEQRAAEAAFDAFNDRLHAAAAAVHAALQEDRKFVLLHLEHASVTEREIDVYGAPDRKKTHHPAPTHPQTRHRHQLLSPPRSTSRGRPRKSNAHGRLPARPVMTRTAGLAGVSKGTVCPVPRRRACRHGVTRSAFNPDLLSSAASFGQAASVSFSAPRASASVAFRLGSVPLNSRTFVGSAAHSRPPCASANSTQHGTGNRGCTLDPNTHPLVKRKRISTFPLSLISPFRNSAYAFRDIAA